MLSIGVTTPTSERRGIGNYPDFEDLTVNCLTMRERRVTFLASTPLPFYEENANAVWRRCFLVYAFLRMLPLYPLLTSQITGE